MEENGEREKKVFAIFVYNGKSRGYKEICLSGNGEGREGGGLKTQKIYHAQITKQTKPKVKMAHNKEALR